MAAPAGRRPRALRPGGAGTRRERRRPQPARGDSPAALGPGGAAGRVPGPGPGGLGGGGGVAPGASGPAGRPGRGEVREPGLGDPGVWVMEEGEERPSLAARGQNRPAKSCWSREAERCRSAGAGFLRRGEGVRARPQAPAAAAARLRRAAAEPPPHAWLCTRVLKQVGLDASVVGLSTKR